jgi:uncharacterized membrane protein YgdD (TMEM256/DUF423 family)
MKPNWIAIGCISAAVSVLLGAYGAHGLQGKVSAGDYEVWRTGVLYQAIHALATIVFGLFREGRRRDGRSPGSAPGWAFLVGTILFSGPLYGHPLGAPVATLHLAPIGGLALILGWILFAIAASSAGKAPEPPG